MPPIQDVPAELQFLFGPPAGPDEIARLGPFHVLKFLGMGGMGFVCMVRDPALRRVVAVKGMLPELTVDKTLQLRFREEAIHMASVKNDHIIRIYEAKELPIRVNGGETSLPFFVMEYLEGEDLASRLRGGARLTVDEVVRIGIEAGRGLAAIHDRGRVHRDVKPSNLFLEGPARRVKILDFGLAREGEQTHITRAGQRVGTDAYMAPEQWDGKEVDGRCDLFSLGCVLYEACTGCRARVKLPQTPHEIAGVPQPLSGIIMKLLATEREQRHASATELLRDLERLAAPTHRTPDLADPNGATLELTFSDLAGSPWEGQARLRRGGVFSAPFPISEGLSARQRLEVRWYVEEFMDLPEGGNLKRAEAVEKLLRRHGEELWQKLPHPEVDDWLAAVRANKGGRLVLRAEKPGDETAFRTSWELLRAGAGGAPLHQLGVSVVRRVSTTLPAAQARDTSAGLRVLVVVCRPEGAGFLDPRYTPEAILDALAKREEVTVDFCRPGTLQALVRTLEQAREADEPYHVVHFDGHGMTAEGGVAALCFENDEGRLDVVLADRLGVLLAGLDIPLVVLAACRTSMKESAEETVATALLRQGVGTVLAMGYAVHVDMDRELITGFYEYIAQGKSLGEALQYGRKQLLANPRRRHGTGPDAATVDLQDWFVPQLYQAGDDPVLLPRKPRSRRRPKIAEAVELPGFPPPPRAGFQGRGRELHRLERALLSQRVVVVHAPGGMGKTTLAREAAHWWTRTGLFPDGAVFVSFEGAPSPDQVVQEVGAALEGEAFHQKKNPEARLAKRLGERAVLVVWDNYESVLPAFNGGKATPPEFAALARQWTRGGSRLLVTSRDAEVGIAGSRPFALGELSQPEGLLLLVRFLERLGIDRGERVKRGLTVEELGKLVDRLGGHPLALELLAPFLRERSVAAVLEELGPLLARAKQRHGEGRNESMWASLHFSIQHLSAEARAALPAVALLAGGCLANMAPRVAGLEEGAWAAVRSELERTGLVRVEGGVLRPHPVLGDVPELEATAEVQERFRQVIVALCGEFDRLVRSEEALTALWALGVCEAVVRRAIEQALAAGDARAAGFMTDSFRQYLQLRGRGGEGAALVTRVHEGLRSSGELTAAAAGMERQAAWARASQDAEGARQALEDLLRRLHAVQGWDTRHQRALALMTLGRVHDDVRRRPAEALAPLGEAEELFQALEEERRIDSTNRSAVLGSRANALSALRRFDEALAAAEAGLALDRERKDGQAVARGLVQIANILSDQGRHQEAEARYPEALAAAGAAGDDELQGIIQQHLGNLGLERSRPEEAVPHLRQALAAFQRARDERGQMRVFNSLGNVEYQRGNREAALAWFERSLEHAVRLGNVEMQATARSNRAVIFSEQAQEEADPQRARGLLEQVIAEERAALALREQLGQPGSIALSHSNLAASLRLVGALDEAEEHAREALAIREPIGDPNTWQTLLILERIAEARGDAAAAAEWRRRKDLARAEAEARSGDHALPLEFVSALLQVAVQARTAGATLEQALADAGAAEGLLETLARREPWLAAHLHALAGGAARPGGDVPAAYRDAVERAWTLTPGSGP